MHLDSKIKHSKGFALVEVLIASAILSMVLLSVYSGISSGLDGISNSRNYTHAIVLSKSLMNEFRKNKMRGVDIKGAEIPEAEGFKYDRVTERYENPLLGPLSVNKTTITIHWKHRGYNNMYRLSMLFKVN